jgi:hypothetical protein
MTVARHLLLDPPSHPAPGSPRIDCTRKNRAHPPHTANEATTCDRATVENMLVVEKWEKMGTWTGNRI